MNAARVDGRDGNPPDALGSVDADPALAARVRTVLGGSGPLRRLPGGRSGLTYALRAGSGEHVVKAVPPGRRPAGRNDVLRQAAVLRALASCGLPVPEVTGWDDVEPAWFAMTLAPGEAAEPVLDGAPDPALARARMLAAARVLGRLHAVGAGRLAAGLVAAGAAPPEPTSPAGELERWTATMHAVPVQLRPGSAELLAALAADVPEPVPPVPVHGDFRLGNLLCVGAEPSALVDWEIWGIGDPRVDLGWFGVFTDPALFPGIGHPVPGLPTEDELLAGYQSARGTGGGTGDARVWFRALGRMKMAAIMGHNLRRHREGTHHDPVQEQLPPTIAALIASGRALLTPSPERQET